MYTSDFPTGRYNLANYFSRKGNLAKAEKYYEEAIRMDNQFYPAKSNLALLLYSQGDYDKAEQIFLDLVKNNKEYTEGYYYLGLLYAEEKRYQEAATYLEKDLLQKKPNARSYYNLGLVYQQLNENKKAEKILLKGNEMAPNNFDLIFALSDFYLKQKDYSKALKYATELKTKFPSKPEGQQLINYVNSQLNAQ